MRPIIFFFENRIGGHAENSSRTANGKSLVVKCLRETVLLVT